VGPRSYITVGMSPALRVPSHFYDDRVEALQCTRSQCRIASLMLSSSNTPGRVLASALLQQCNVRRLLTTKCFELHPELLRESASLEWCVSPQHPCHPGIIKSAKSIHSPKRSIPLLTYAYAACLFLTHSAALGDLPRVRLEPEVHFPRLRVLGLTNAVFEDGGALELARGVVAGERAMQALCCGVPYLPHTWAGLIKVCYVPYPCLCVQASSQPYPCSSSGAPGAASQSRRCVAT
jgi:hypothetical protein